MNDHEIFSDEDTRTLTEVAADNAQDFRRALVETAEAAGVEGHRVEAVKEEIEVIEQRPIVLPTGELVDLSDMASCATALAAVREIEQHIKEVRGAIVDAFAAERERRGVDEIELPDGTVVTVKRKYDVVWDAEGLEEELRALEMPEERIREIIIEEVSRTVKTVEANKSARRNAAYAEAIARARTEVEKRPTISLPRG